MVSCPYTCPIGSHYPVFAYPFLEHLAAHKVKGVDAREATYTDVLTNRGNGWHSTDAAHCEQPWMSQMWMYSNGFVDLYYCEEVRPACTTS